MNAARVVLLAGLLLGSSDGGVFVDQYHETSVASEDWDANGNVYTDSTGVTQVGSECTAPSGAEGDVCMGSDLEVQGAISGPVRTKRFSIYVGDLIPDTTNGAGIGTGGCGTGTCATFATDVDDIIRFNFHMPDCWTGAADFQAKLRWATIGDAMTLAQTVSWQHSWRAKTVGEALNGGSEATQTVTYTEAGNPGTDLALIETTLTFDYDSASQPIAAGDTVYWRLQRDVDTDNYDGIVYLQELWIEYPATLLSCE